MVKRFVAFSAALALASGLLAASSAPSLAFSRPEQACAAHSADFSTPGLWLGHFTGGRMQRDASGARVLDWRDDYACFPTGKSCARWEHSLLRVYRSAEGYKTCTPLRGGGVRIRPFRNVVTAKY